MMKGFELLTTGGVPPDKLEECLEWAFGEGWRFALNLGSLRDLWNKKHSEIFYVGVNDSWQMFFVAVGKAFMEVNYHDTVRSEAKRHLA